LRPSSLARGSHAPGVVSTAVHGASCDGGERKP